MNEDFTKRMSPGGIPNSKAKVVGKPGSSPAKTSRTCSEHLG